MNTGFGLYDVEEGRTWTLYLEPQDHSVWGAIVLNLSKGDPQRDIGVEA